MGVGVSFVPRLSCSGRAVRGPGWDSPDARLSAGVSLAAVCSCLVWGGRSLTGLRGLPRPVWRPFVDLGGCLSLPLPGGGCRLRWGVVWGSPWAVFPRPRPPPFFFPRVVGVCSWPCRWGPYIGCGDGGGLWVWFLVLWCCGSLVVAVAYSGRGPRCLRSPPPLRLFFLSFFCAVLVVSASSWSVACLFPGRGVCRRVRGVSSSGPSVAAWSLWGTFFGCASLSWAGWSLGVLSVGPVGSAHGGAWLGGGAPRWSGCLASRLCSFPSCFPPVPLAGCALMGWRGPLGGFLFVGGGFPPFLVIFFREGVACSFLCPPPAGACTGRCAVWLTGSLFVLRVAAGSAPAPCAIWLMYTHGLAARSVGLGLGSAGCAVVPAGFVGSWVRGGGGWLGQFFGVRLPSVPPPLWGWLGAGGLNFPVAPRAGGPPRVGGRGLRPVFPAPPLRGRGVCTAGRVVAFSLCVMG